MKREQAIELLNEHITKEKQISHLLDTEKIMGALATHLQEDERIWSLAGLLHDIDYNYTLTDPFAHGQVAEEILAPYGIEDNIIYAIKSHNQVAEEVPLSKMDKALFCADPTSSFLRQCIEDEGFVLDGEWLVKQFNDKKFAVGVSRIQIASCVELGLTLEEFLTISCRALIALNQE